MLDQGNDSPRLNELTNSLSCGIEFPESWGDFFEKSGPMPSGPGDKRQCPRYYFRSAIAIEYMQTIPALSRECNWYKVYSRDLSRCGVSFVHAEQLFPGEHINVLLQGDREAVAEVAWCSRIRAKCFAVGARFV